MLNTLQRIFSGAGQVTRLKDNQEMKIINIGLARTATSSFVEAMRMLGLKSYHMKDGVQDSEGHAEMWIEHADLVIKLHGGKSWRDAMNAPIAPRTLEGDPGE